MLNFTLCLQLFATAQYVGVTSVDIL